MGPIRTATQGNPLVYGSSPEGEARTAAPPPSDKKVAGDQTRLSHEDKEGKQPLPSFGAWADEGAARAESKALEANPYRVGQDAARAKATREQDQQLLDHVCGKGCGCGRGKGVDGEDPLKSLEKRDQEVRQHEQEHLGEAGEHARGGPELETVTASNGNQYAVAGKVKVDVSEDADPSKTYAKMEKIERSALKPTDPSDQDRKVAAEAAGKRAEAMRKLQAQGINPQRVGRPGLKRFLAGLTLGLLLSSCWASSSPNLWTSDLKRARYVDLTHTIEPDSPVWHGFGPSQFGPTVDPATNQPYTYAKDGFEATRYTLSTDQLGTQLDPPAHWNPDYASIDELPATFALRPLCVISIVPQVVRNPGYALSETDVHDWESRNGPVPEGSVVFVRSDWSKRWGEPGLAAETVFPGVSLAALKYLHEKRHILFHGHEPLDTDTTPNLEGEAWLLRNGYTQAEGVANLDQVPETGALVAIGYPKLRGGTGGYARYIAICPESWKYGVRIGDVPESPLARQAAPLRWDSQKGYRTRTSP